MSTDTILQGKAAKQTRIAIYTRVSTLDQSDEGQERELCEFADRRNWTVAEVYKDKISGIKNSRPELDRLLADAKKGRFSHVIVWRIDRLGWSVSHLLQVLETFKALDIKFVSLSEAIDTSTPTGMMIFTVLAAVAALERSILVEPVRMGIQNARRRGVQLGRPALKKLNLEEISKIRAERLRGATFRRLAQDHGVSVWTVHKLCSKVGQPRD
jgi:DNA invertase Pin-like site-specific DNA recombinase